MFQRIQNSNYWIYLQNIVQGSRISLDRSNHLEISTLTGIQCVEMTENDIRELHHLLGERLTWQETVRVASGEIK